MSALKTNCYSLNQIASIYNIYAYRKPHIYVIIVLYLYAIYFA